MDQGRACIAPLDTGHHGRQLAGLAAGAAAGFQNDMQAVCVGAISLMPPSPRLANLGKGVSVEILKNIQPIEENNKNSHKTSGYKHLSAKQPPSYPQNP